HAFFISSRPAAARRSSATLLLLEVRREIRSSRAHSTNASNLPFRLGYPRRNCVLHCGARAFILRTRPALSVPARQQPFPVAPIGLSLGRRTAPAQWQRFEGG